MKTETFVGQVASIDRQPSSSNGNPRYRVGFATHDGPRTHDTGVDYAVGYEISNYYPRSGHSIPFLRVVLDVRRNGVRVIRSVTPVEVPDA